MSFTTPPHTRKRKATTELEDESAGTARISKKISAPLPTTPATPLTELGSPVNHGMDSEDEYMSDGTSLEEEDFEGTQDSDDGESCSVGSVPISLPSQYLAPLLMGCASIRFW